MLRELRNFGRVIFQDENVLLEILQECKILNCLLVFEKKKSQVLSEFKT
jgi:hypothetical protein